MNFASKIVKRRLNNPEIRVFYQNVSNTTANIPEKLFFIVPLEPKSGKKWMKKMKRAHPPGDNS